MNQHHHINIPADFTDPASYQAYLKAEAAGLVHACGKGNVQTSRHMEPQPPAQAPAAYQPTSLTARPICPASGDGKTWVDCPGFPDLAVLKAI